NPEDTSKVKTVTFGENRTLEKQNDPPKGPNDGRTEVYDDSVKNDGYKVSKKPEEANTIVFRSYNDPDENSSTLTKLKVEYVNTVKTGGLKIQKQAAAGEVDNIKGTYKFKVTFSDVGGAGLEKEDIIRYVEIDMNDAVKYPDHTVTITGIPVGTRYTIEELAPTDGSRLQSVTVP
ncbi:Cna protein B-type domain protein, partial [human gut metagenome]